MNLRSLACCRCGGPLAPSDTLPTLIDCLYCGTINAATADATSEATERIDVDVRNRAITRFTEALVAALNAGQPPFEAVRAASAAHLGVAGRTDTIARIAIALAQDFEREEKVSIDRDATVLSRIANAYLVALEVLRTSESYDLNLPFLTATARGPLHLRRTLTSKLLAELGTRDPSASAVSPPAAKDQAASAKKSKGWWPF